MVKEPVKPRKIELQPDKKPTRSTPRYLDFKDHFLLTHNISFDQIVQIANSELTLLNELRETREDVQRNNENIKTQIEALKQAKPKDYMEQKENEEYIQILEARMEAESQRIFKIWAKTNNTEFLEIIYKIVYNEPNKTFLRIMQDFYHKYVRENETPLSKELLFLATLIRYTIIITTTGNQTEKRDLKLLLDTISKYRI